MSGLLIAFLNNKTPFKRWSTLKGKNLLVEEQIILLRVHNQWKGKPKKKKRKWQSLFYLHIHPFLHLNCNPTIAFNDLVFSPVSRPYLVIPSSYFQKLNKSSPVSLSGDITEICEFTKAAGKQDQVKRGCSHGIYLNDLARLLID
ncbi:MAG: hypothetical protein AB2705_20320 [Candidatus Thiodiazotropha sp.]